MIQCSEIINRGYTPVTSPLACSSSQWGSFMIMKHS